MQMIILANHFHLTILIKRVEAVLRRKNNGKVEEKVLKFEGLKLDITNI